MKIASVIDIRPQFVKASVLSHELKKKHEEILIHNGQHYDYQMNKIFFDQLNIPEPDYHLNIGSGSHGYQTGEMLKKIEVVLVKEKLDLVLTYGDTNSTLAGALAASNSLVGSDKEKIVRVVKEFRPILETYKNRFGNEGASKNIVPIIDSL